MKLSQVIIHLCIPLLLFAKWFFAFEFTKLISFIPLINYYIYLLANHKYLIKNICKNVFLRKYIYAHSFALCRCEICLIFRYDILMVYFTNLYSQFIKTHDKPALFQFPLFRIFEHYRSGYFCLLMTHLNIHVKIYYVMYSLKIWVSNKTTTCLYGTYIIIIYSFSLGFDLL